MKKIVYMFAAAALMLTASCAKNAEQSADNATENQAKEQFEENIDNGSNPQVETQKASNLIELAGDNLEQLTAEKGQVLAIDFGATWCGPCRLQGPILEQVKSRIGDSASILKIDIDQNGPLAAEYNVRSVPTLILFKNGEAVWRAVGLQQADVLEQKLREHM